MSLYCRHERTVKTLQYNGNEMVEDSCAERPTHRAVREVASPAPEALMAAGVPGRPSCVTRTLTAHRPVMTLLLRAI